MPSKDSNTSDVTLIRRRFLSGWKGWLLCVVGAILLAMCLIHSNAVNAWKEREQIHSPPVTSYLPDFIETLIVPRVWELSSARRSLTTRMKGVALSLHEYSYKYGEFPLTRASNPGLPQHSWRTFLLPMMDEQDAYSRWRFDLPWDRQMNLPPETHALICRDIYGGPDPQTGITHIVAVTGPETAWPPDRGLRFSEITDSQVTTLLCIEYPASDIHWAEPRDLTMEEAIDYLSQPDVPGSHSTRPRFPARRGTPCLRVVNTEGGVRLLRLGLPRETLRALLTINGGETIDEESVFVEML